MTAGPTGALSSLLAATGLIDAEEAALELPALALRLRAGGRLETVRELLADTASLAAGLERLSRSDGITLAMPGREELATLLDAALAADPQATVLERCAAPAPAPGDAVWAPVRELGRGGMGRVLLVREEFSGRDAALKTMLLPEGEQAVRFAREARITAALDHPAIPATYQGGRLATGERYYTQPVLPGRTLAALLAGDPPPALRRRIEILWQVARAMAHAHAAGVIHRDLKPANVMVGDQGQVWVIDWGIAGMTNDERRMTNRGGQACCVPRYSSIPSHAHLHLEPRNHGGSRPVA